MHLNRLQILIGILGRCQCGSSHKGPEGNGNPKKKRFALPLGLMWRCQLRISNIVVCTENPKMEGYYRLCSEAKGSQAEETPCSPWPSGPACSPPSSCSPCPSGAPFKPPAPAPWSHCPPRPRPAIRCSSKTAFGSPCPEFGAAGRLWEGTMRKMAYNASFPQESCQLLRGNC